MHTQLCKKAFEYVQKIKGEFLHIEEIQQTEFDMVISIDMTTGNDPMR